MCDTFLPSGMGIAIVAIAGYTLLVWLPELLLLRLAVRNSAALRCVPLPHNPALQAAGYCAVHAEPC